MRLIVLAIGWLLGILVADLFALQILVQQGVVGLGNSLHQPFPVLMHQLDHVSRHIGTLRLGAQLISEEPCLLLDQVYYAAERILNADRELDRNGERTDTR